MRWEAPGNKCSGHFAGVILIKDSKDHPATCPKLELQTQERGKSCRSQEGQIVLQRREFQGKRGDPGRWSGEMGMG